MNLVRSLVRSLSLHKQESAQCTSILFAYCTVLYFAFQPGPSSGVYTVQSYLRLGARALRGGREGALGREERINEGLGRENLAVLFHIFGAKSQFFNKFSSLTRFSFFVDFFSQKNYLLYHCGLFM